MKLSVLAFKIILSLLFKLMQINLFRRHFGLIQLEVGLIFIIR